jgi:hypothetical protein
MARKDIHRPAMIEPADYQFVAFDYLPSDGDPLGAAMFLAEQRKYKRAHMEKSGGFYSQHEHGGLCHICGSVNAVYSASFYHAKSNSYIKAGLDCAQKLECEGIEAFRKNVKKAKEAAAGKNKAKAVLHGFGLSAAWDLYEADAAKRKAHAVAYKAWQDDGADEESAPQYPEWSKDEYTALDIVSRLVKWGAISDKAASFLGQLLDRIERAPEIAAEKAAAKALEMADAKPVPVVEGRVLVKGEVLSVREQDGFYGVQIKMLVKSDAGFKLWGTVPSSISEEVKKGSLIEFSASLDRSDDDQYFGFFKRPSKAKVLNALAA